MATITLKTPADLARMRQAGRIVAEALDLVRENVRPGVTTAELDRLAEDCILSRRARPAFKGYCGFPATLCTSLNEVVVHGIPCDETLKEGDLLSVDCGAFFEGFAADAAITVEVGECSEEARRLVRATRQCLAAGIAAVRAGVRVVDVSAAIEQVACRARLGVVDAYTGHGIGRELHEPPQVPNFAGAQGLLNRSAVLKAGATIALEPMMNLGGAGTRKLADGWTVVTADGSLSAHFEHTVAVTKDGASILTVR